MSKNDDTISRQWLLDLYETPKDGDDVDWKVPLEVVQQNIKDAPAIDAVPVVRCGECKHMIEDGRCMEFADDGIRPSASDFCSYGKRREEGDE